MLEASVRYKPGDQIEKLPYMVSEPYQKLIYKINRSFIDCKCECGKIRPVPLTEVLKKKWKIYRCQPCSLAFLNTVNIKDKKRGMLTAKEYIHRIGKSGKWKCKCKCGNICFLTANAFLKKKIKNCGCKKPKISFTKGNAFKGYGEISSSLFKSYKRGAKNRNLEFNITIEEIWELFLKQNRMCALSKQYLTFGNNPQTNSASLDRIDNNKGYTKDNIQWIHKHIQQMKWAFDQDYFIQTCKDIARYNNRFINQYILNPHKKGIFR